MRVRGVGVVLAVVALVGAGCSDEDDAAATAEDTGPPVAELVADFSYDTDYEVTGSTSCPLRDITFTDESTGDPETWSWSFPDGSSSTEPDPRVTRAIAEATLTVTRGDESDTITKPIDLVVC